MHAAGAPPITVSPAKCPVSKAPRVVRIYLTTRFGTSLSSHNEDQHYSRRSQQYWDKFYKRHKNKFFKDRHYLEKDWRSYFDDEIESSNGKVVLEVGCGAGNTIFPLIATFPKLYIYACDFSPNAITLVKSHANYSAEKMNVFVCDVAKDDLCVNVMPFSVDVVTLIFTLSAVSPCKMASILENCKQVLKPNGHILLRDYAVGDSAQMLGIPKILNSSADTSAKMEVLGVNLIVPGLDANTKVKLHDRNQMISENFYFRGDGTCSFYFSEAYAASLFQSAGFAIVDINTYCKEITNHSRNIIMQRRWIRGIFGRS